MSSARIVQLSSKIAYNVAVLDEYLRTQGLPSLSFDLDGLSEFEVLKEHPEIENARVAALEATIELQDLLQGTTALLGPTVNATSLQAIYKYDIVSKVPIHGEISFRDLAVSCNICEPDLIRILRFAMIHHRVFTEPRKGFVAHTAASCKLVEDRGHYDRLGMMYDELWQGMAQTVNAMEKFKGHELNETGFSLAHDTTDSLYEYHDKHPEKARRFAGAMKAYSERSGQDTLEALKAYDWGSIQDQTVVDIGGSRGHISMALAQALPSFKFIVQDRPETVNGAIENVPMELRERVSFMEHDCLSEQPIVAGAYLLRRVLHNWPDEYCVKILQNLRPALRPGARIVIDEILLPEPNSTSVLKERRFRAMDMLMMSMFNARERDREGWISLFQQADSRFRFVDAIVPSGLDSAIIEAVWEP
ncbi:hypothetical protein ACLMJK_006552 [Lecanora helva]